MTTTIKSTIINTVAVAIALLMAVGLFNVDAMPSFAEYANNHLGGYMAFVFWFSMGLLMFITPLIAGFALEVPMWESNTRVGFAFANAMHNARESWFSFGAVVLLGGSITTLSSWGFITIVCG